MKIKKYTLHIVLFSLSLFLFSCHKEAESRWNIETKTSETVKITDISAEFYNEKIPFPEFKEKYSFFLFSHVLFAEISNA